MIRIKQISLFLHNKPGVLSKICGTLARQKVNILGISVVDTHDHAVVRMLVDKPRPAIHALEDRGILVMETDVLLLDLPNRVGALGALARKLGSAGVNIKYSYCTAGTKADNACLVIAVDDIKKAESTLKPLLKNC
jgi:hypothetical protein